MSEYHQPVLLGPAIEGLRIRPDGIYVDATFGGGGHAREIMNYLDDKGHLFVFDQDVNAATNVWDDDRLTLIAANFRYLTPWMKYYGVYGKVNGILADLGVSSYQLDEPTRGFSYRFDEPLDMRMNVMQSKSAADVINSYDVVRLQQMFSQYGEITNARTLAARIAEARGSSPIKTTGQLADIVVPCIKGQRWKYLSQLYQALRIEINDEIGALRDLLTSATETLAENGRMVVISYHSLEDRLVKRFFKAGNFEGEPDADFFGTKKKGWNVITPRPIEPDDEEQKLNPRSRSAKMRIAEKLI